MNILIFTNSLAGGGAERVAATLANFWAQKSWNVTIVTLNPESEDFYPLDPRVGRLSLNLSGDSRHAFDGLLQNVRRVAALRRAIMHIRPAVAISMMSTPNVLLALASRGISGLCTIGSERCYPPHAPIGRVWSALRRKMYGRLSAVVGLTSECGEWIRMHCPATRVFVIPNAVVWPLPKNSPTIDPHSLCPRDRKIVLAVGRLDAVKNFSVLIHVFAQLAVEHQAWDLVILGEGPERPLLESVVRGHQLGARIFLPGIAGNVGEWYGRAELCVMTSRSEGFPNALAEALCHGLPAVSFDCNTGPRDIIRHGIDGLLVPADDAVALRHALGRMMGDADLRRRLAMRAADARERFALEKIAGMWEALIGELTEPHAISETTYDARQTMRCPP